MFTMPNTATLYAFLCMLYLNLMQQQYHPTYVNDIKYITALYTYSQFYTCTSIKIINKLCIASTFSFYHMVSCGTCMYDYTYGVIYIWLY
jgi:hypothetical protein